MSKNRFGEHLTLLNPKKKRTDSKWHYCGLKLKQAAAPPGSGGG
jgi:hypothetical protein